MDVLEDSIGVVLRLNVQISAHPFPPDLRQLSRPETPFDQGAFDFDTQHNV